MSTERRMNEEINSLLKLGVPREFAEIIVYNKYDLDVSAPIEAIKTEAEELQEATRYMVPFSENCKQFSTEGFIVNNVGSDNSEKLMSNLILNDKN